MILLAQDRLFLNRSSGAFSRYRASKDIKKQSYNTPHSLAKTDMHASKEQQKTLITLTKRSDFVETNTHGRKWVSKSVILQVRENTNAQKRVGYTVSKKVDKSAVKRNRIKRRLRAAAAEVLPPSAQHAHDYVLIGRAQTAQTPYKSICNDLKWCLKRLNCIENTAKIPKNHQKEPKKES